MVKLLLEQMVSDRGTLCPVKYFRGSTQFLLGVMKEISKATRYIAQPEIKL